MLHSTTDTPRHPIGRREATKPLVMPFARALDVLAAYTPEDRWLGNRALAERTGLPASTVTRMTHSLAHLGYLQRGADGRTYRLAPAVLGLGYAAAPDAGVRRAARGPMKTLADAHEADLALWSRDRLELTVIASCRSARSALDAEVTAGMRAGIGSSAVGWSLLAILPDPERFYLMQRIEHRATRDWPRQRRKMCEAISQVKEQGYCLSIDDRGEESALLTVPILLDNHAPIVLSCAVAPRRYTRSRLQREVAPTLVAAAAEIGRVSASDRVERSR